MYSIGDRIDEKYRVIRLLGEGGMGAVVGVVDLDGRECALKYCKDHDVDSLRRFAREVRVMQLISHQNVVAIIESNLEHDPPYFVMPLAARALSDEIGVVQWSTTEAVAVALQVCAGVEAIHASGATHRDLKPANVLRLADGTLAVADLGLAKINARDTTVLTDTTMGLGTEAYAAPEQYVPGGSRDADARTDVYQLGKMLYELVTGQLPYLMDLSVVDPGLAFIIGKATRSNAQERFATVAELAASLFAYQTMNDPDATAPAAFDGLIRQAADLVGEGRYDAAVVARILHHVRAAAAEPGEVIALVERVPDEILSHLAATAPTDAEALVFCYRDALAAVISSYNYEHAEIVAGKMRRVFLATTHPELKAAAVEATLLAAVGLHRFAAMEVFDQMLTAIVEPGDALAIGHVLMRNQRAYRVVADRVPRQKLHPALQRSRDSALGDQGMEES